MTAALQVSSTVQSLCIAFAKPFQVIPCHQCKVNPQVIKLRKIPGIVIYSHPDCSEYFPHKPKVALLISNISMRSQ